MDADSATLIHPFPILFDTACYNYRRCVNRKISSAISTSDGSSSGTCSNDMSPKRVWVIRRKVVKPTSPSVVTVVLDLYIDKSVCAVKVARNEVCLIATYSIHDTARNEFRI